MDGTNTRLTYLKVPCRLIFRGNQKGIDKIKLLLQESEENFAEVKKMVIIKKGSDVIDCIVDEKVVPITTVNVLGFKLIDAHLP